MTANPKGFARPDLVITPADLAARLGSPGAPLLLDMRPAEAFAAGQIPGAVHLDLWGVSLIDTDPAPLRAFLWIIEHQFALRGVTDDRSIVVYDEQSGARAARAFWFLEFFGHPDVRVLDGGFNAWAREGLPVSREPQAPVPSEWHGTPTGDRLATWREVDAMLGHRDTAMLDTRSDEEYTGTLVRARRGGAIPGAAHVEWTRALDANGAFKTAAELRTMYEAAGVSPDREVVTYCQGGYRGAHAYLVLRLLGYPRVRNYLGSWKEWGDREDLAIEHPTRP